LIALLLHFAYFISKIPLLGLYRSRQIESRPTWNQPENEKIRCGESKLKEIGKLITSYNEMIDELEIRLKKLAKGAEQAWREMQTGGT